MPSSGSTSRIASRNDICGCTLRMVCAASALACAIVSARAVSLRGATAAVSARAASAVSATMPNIDPQPPHLRRIDVDTRDLQARRRAHPNARRHLQPRAERDQQIGLLATAGRPPRWSIRADAGRRRCRGRCGTIPQARRYARPARGFPPRRAARRRRPRSSAPRAVQPALPARRSGPDPASACGCSGSGSCGVTSALAENWSHGISSATGLRRPDCISWNARATRYGACDGCSMRSAHFSRLRKVASWSGNSCSEPRSRADHRAGHLAGEAQHWRIHTPRGGQARRVVFSTPGPGTTA